MQGNRASSLSEVKVSWFFSSFGGNLGYILELWQVYPLTPFVFSATSALFSSQDGHLRSFNYSWQNNTDASGGEAEHRGSLSIWHSDNRIPVHLQEVSGIVTLRSIEFHVPLKESEGCEAPCPDEPDTCGFL